MQFQIFHLKKHILRMHIFQGRSLNSPLFSCLKTSFSQNYGIKIIINTILDKKYQILLYK